MPEVLLRDHAKLIAELQTVLHDRHGTMGLKPNAVRAGAIEASTEVTVGAITHVEAMLSLSVYQD